MKVINENEELDPSQGREKPTMTYKNIKIGAFGDIGESMSISERGSEYIVGKSVKNSTDRTLPQRNITKWRNNSKHASK